MMSSRYLILALVVCFAPCEVSGIQLSSQVSLNAMEMAFTRSEKAHSKSMTSIMAGMSPQKAWHVLSKNNLTTPALVELKSQLHGKQAQLRKAAPKGYSGIDGARKMLNDMIYTSMKKYDEEIARCTGYYAEQCAAMEICRGQISQANYVAANSRKLILDAQAAINHCEVRVPTVKLELKMHNEKCTDIIAKMRERLKVIEADIEVMTTILQMTDCKSSSFAQMKKLALLRCQNACNNQTFVTFDHDILKKKVSQLQSSVSRKLMHENFADLFEGIEELQAAETSQVAAPKETTTAKPTPLITKTAFNNPPVPRTEVPSDPCTDPDLGAPSADDKQRAKCTITASPQCPKLQERFLLIQSGIKDEKDTLLADIASIENYCKETRDTLAKQIDDCEEYLTESQTKLAFAFEKEATSAEEARTTAAKHELLDNDLKKQMKTCSTNYINFETELCALKKIRGELYKMKGGGHSAFFQDCEVSKWEPEECSVECKHTNDPDGEQKLTRNVMTHPDGGSKCLPLQAVKKCNLQPCPVDCKLDGWTGWSHCSAECGGGVQQRLREVRVASAYGGKPCGQTSETRACNNQACESDCVISPWSKWSTCSKDCDGGTRKRQKFVVKASTGAGKCANPWSKERLEYKKCNMHRCQTGLACKRQDLDIVFLLDGSGSLGQTGWNAEIKAANTFVDAFSGAGAKPNMAVILYSGPRYWSGVFKCWARNAKNVNMETDCKIKTITHFTSDMADVKKKINALSWPKGSTMTSLALMTAKAELSLGRKDAKSVVVIITDGRPISYGRTSAASWALRKKARVVWVPVTKYAPLRWVKKWASRRWQENVVPVRGFSELEQPEVVTHVVANICPMKR